MNLTIFTYLSIICGTLAMTFFLLKRYGHAVVIYVVAEIIYGGIASYAALKVGHDFFQVFQLLALGGFIGGPIFLFMCAFFARKKFKLFASVNALVLGATIYIGMDAFFVEPHMLDVTRHSIMSSKLNSPLRLCILADLQTDNVGDYERHVLSVVAREKPDILLLPGDYVQVFTPAQWNIERDKLRQAFKELNIAPRFGTYAVQGNVDDFSCWQQIFTDVPGHTFETTETVSAGPVDITGLSFYDGRNTDLRVPKKEKFHIVMAHYPDFSLGKIEADLLVAGHCHGGQVQIPFYGPIVTMSNVPSSWINGNLVKLSSQTNLLISRGIGMERHNAPRLRFWCRPQLIFVDLVPDKIKPQAKNMMSPVVSSWDQRSELTGSGF